MKKQQFQAKVNFYYNFFGKLWKYALWAIFKIKLKVCNDECNFDEIPH